VVTVEAVASEGRPAATFIPADAPHIAGMILELTEELARSEHSRRAFIGAATNAPLG
jgi:hypothetical protein